MMSKVDERALLRERVRRAGSHDPDELERLADEVLTLPGMLSFLDVDLDRVRLIEDLLDHEDRLSTHARARLMARLARELLGDISSDSRREQLIRSAQSLVDADGDADAETLVLVLLDLEHARWGTDRAEVRLAVMDRVIAAARKTGNVDAELTALMWRFNSQLELGHVAAAEQERARYARLASLAELPEALMVARSREATLAVIRGDYDLAATVARDVRAQGEAIGHPDTERLVTTLLGIVAFDTDPEALVDLPGMAEAYARRMPGLAFRLIAARALVVLGRPDEARAAVATTLHEFPRAARARTVALADLAFAAGRLEDESAARVAYDLLSTLDARCVVGAVGVLFVGTVEHHLGVVETVLGDADSAITRLEGAVTAYAAMGALPLQSQAGLDLAKALARRGRAEDLTRARHALVAAKRIAQTLGMTSVLRWADELEGSLTTAAVSVWQLSRQGDVWTLVAGAEEAQLRHLRGLEQLAELLTNPHTEIAATTLAGAATGASEPVADLDALRAYRDRLSRIEDEMANADARGDEGAGGRLAEEREALLRELRRTTGLGGKQRVSGPAEQARVNVTRTLHQAVDRISQAAPLAGAHLRASVHTGSVCVYEPAAGGPVRWRVSTDPHA